MTQEAWQIVILQTGDRQRMWGRCPRKALKVLLSSQSSGDTVQAQCEQQRIRTVILEVTLAAA